jgi:hypothetical protein
MHFFLQYRMRSAQYSINVFFFYRQNIPDGMSLFLLTIPDVND